MKKIISNFILFAALVAISRTSLVLAEEVKDPGANEPEWAKRLSYNIEVETDRVPIFYFETIQPLYQDIDETQTYFIQPRVSIKARDATYNLGTGYRKLISENWLLGANIFGDYQDDHGHGRVGIGGEALGKRLEARINGYWGVTSPRKVEEADGVITTLERVIDGVDYELGAPLPYLPWLKLYGAGYWWNYKYAGDRVGWKSRLEATINKFSVVEFYMWDDNKGEHEIGGKIGVKIPFDNWGDIRKTFIRLAEEPYPSKDLKEYNLIPVKRNFNIVVERWNETPSGKITVQVGRGN